MGACPAAERVYLGRDNTIELVLLEDGRRVALDQYVRFQLEVGELTIDSDVSGLGDGEVFDTAQTRVVDGRSVPVLTLRLGTRPLSAGTYSARLVAYTAEAVNGVVFGHFTLEVLT